MKIQQYAINSPTTIIYLIFNCMSPPWQVQPCLDYTTGLPWKENKLLDPIHFSSEAVNSPTKVIIAFHTVKTVNKREK
jgi:hypothetical protein